VKPDRRAKPIRRAVAIVAVFVVALGALFVFSLVDDGEARSNLLGKPAPPFDVERLSDGASLTSESLRGRTVVVNFWNTWCVPCIREHPALQEFYERHRDEPDFAMVGIVREDTEAAAREYVEREKVDWAVGLDPDGRAAIDYGTTGQPETFVIGPDGVVAAELFGEASVAHLESMLARAQGRA
jgi:cytochrome c biogenesis protein CcmG/thiol:disulfide interchange protein DsbE